MTMNAGAIPKNHWTQDQDVGGGRIIGEAYYIDLMRYLLVANARLFPQHASGPNSGNRNNRRCSIDNAIL